MSKSIVTALSAALVGTSLVAPGVAADDGALAEVVVTAQRREQKLSEVPVAISAITAQEFQRRSAQSLDDIQAMVPSLRMVDIGPGSQRIQLRGVSQYLGQATVGNYIDEFSVTNPGPVGVAEVQLIDLERVEVLRGPQPALYGEGSMGGTIRYITADPDLETPRGSVAAEGSSTADGEMGYRVEGIASFPIAPGVAGLRLAAQKRKVGGWVDSPSGEDYNGREVTTVRAKLLAQPSEQFTVSLLGLYNESTQDSISFSLDGLKTAQKSITPANQKYTLGVLQASYDFGAVTLQSVTGYLDQSSFARRDIGPFFNTLFGFPAFTAAFSDANGTFERVSQELRLTSRSDQTFRYLFGATVAEGKGGGPQFTTYKPAPFPAFGIFNDRFDPYVKSETTAIYGNLEFDFASRFTLEAGGRYFREKLTQRGTTTSFDAGGPGVPRTSTVAGKGTFSTFNPRVSLRADFDGRLVYASAARGFRSGGFNLAQGSQNPTFDPESLWTYEVGTKLSFLDNRLYLEAAVYYQDYTDIQSTNVTPLGGTAVFNSGKADGSGVDLALVLRPTDTFRLTTSWGYNDVSFTTTAVDKRAGDPLDLVPPNNVSVAAEWRPAKSGNIQWTVNVDANYTEKGAIILRQIAALGFRAVAPNDSRTLVNARVSADFGNYEIFGYGTNLGNALKQVNPSFAAFVEPIFTQPRTIGAGIRYQF
ncbi:MAG: TonB-dependent receptor [Sinobacteraceae bacterium]|nr:TonB-dependent receptor [Nevskiaceae bacterium]